MRRSSPQSNRRRSGGRSLGHRRDPASAARHRLVHIDVIATDARGRTVDDLKPADFELREEGTVQSARRGPVRAATRRAGRRAGADSIGRRRTRGGRRRRAAVRDLPRRVPRQRRRHAPTASREALLRFVDRDLTPRDLVVVMKPLDSLFAIRLTRDRDAVRQRDRRLRRAQGTTTSRATPTSATSSPARRRASTRSRNQVALSAINALAVHLGGLRRRTQDADRRHRRHRPCRSGAAARSSCRRSTRCIRSANRSNVADLPFDPRSRRRERRRRRRAAADACAAKPTARRSPAIWTPACAARPPIRARYYLLTYRSAHADDGQFREVAGASEARRRPAARAQGLLGAVAGRRAARDAARARERAEEAGAARTGAARQPADSAVVRRFARDRRGKTRVTFVWEPAARVPGDRASRRIPTRARCSPRATADGTVLFDGPGRADRPGDDRRARRRRRRAPSSTCRQAGCGCGCRFRT